MRSANHRCWKPCRCRSADRSVSGRFEALDGDGGGDDDEVGGVLKLLVIPGLNGAGGGGQRGGEREEREEEGAGFHKIKERPRRERRAKFKQGNKAKQVKFRLLLAARNGYAVVMHYFALTRAEARALAVMAMVAAVAVLAWGW